MIKKIRRAYWRWKFKRLHPADREVARYMGIDPESLILRGEL